MRIKPVILLVGPRPVSINDVGGASALFETIVREITQLRRVSCFVLYYPSSRDLLIKKAWRLVNLIPKLFSFICRSDVVSVHCSSGLPIVGLISLIICKLFKKKLILRQFGCPNYNNILAKWAISILKKHCDLILLETQLQIQSDEIFKGGNIKWFPNHRPSYIRKKRISEACKKFVYIGYIHPCKGIYEILEALKHMKLEYPVDFYGSIAKEFDREKFLQNPNIEYKGILETYSVYEVLEKYDAILLPSYWPSEGHPGVIIEALQVSLPVISTRWRAIPEIVDESCGFLIAPKNAMALKDAMEMLINFKGLYKSLSMGAKQRALEFDSKHWANVFIDYCIEILKD